MPACRIKSGDRYNKLVAIRPAQMRGKHRLWLFRCDCGAEKEIHGYKARSGHTQSCGCLGLQRLAERRLKHGGARSAIYDVWSAIKSRCSNPRNPGFKDYGGRGIRICNEWRESFQAFFDYVGPRPSPAHSIDRIDNDGNYEPGNVRWATRVEQARNKRPRFAFRAHDMVLGQMSLAG